MIALYFCLFICAAMFCLIIDDYYIKYRTVALALLGLLMALYVGLRDGNSVSDYYNYIDFYKDSDPVVEGTFVMISLFVKVYLFNEVVFVFVIYAFIAVIIKLLAIKSLTELYFLSVLVYISSLFILHEMTQIRVGVSSGLLLLTIKPIYERNWKHFLFITVAATMFHYSAALIIFLWFLRSETINNKVFYLIIPVGFLLYFLSIDLVLTIPIDYLKDKVLVYKELQEYDIDEYNNINVFNSLFLFRCALYYLMLYNMRYLKEKNKYFVLLLKIYAISLFSFPAFSQMPVIAFRISELLSVVEIILIPQLFYLLNPRFYSKAIIIGICLVFAFINIFYNKLIL